MRCFVAQLCAVMIKHDFLPFDGRWTSRVDFVFEHKVGPLHFKVGDALYRSDLCLSIRKFGPQKAQRLIQHSGNLVAVDAV